MKKMSIFDMIVISLFTAVNFVMSQIMIPLPFTPIPVNLAMLAVFISGAVLKSVHSALSNLIFIILGLIGLPVFAGLHGGIATILGPTGGFIISYVFSAFTVGFIIENSEQKLYTYFVAMIAGLLVTYAFGTIWYNLYSTAGFFNSFLVCVLPFIPFDIAKVVIGALTSFKINNLLG